MLAHNHPQQALRFTLTDNVPVRVRVCVCVHAALICLGFTLHIVQNNPSLGAPALFRCTAAIKLLMPQPPTRFRHHPSVRTAVLMWLLKDIKYTAIFVWLQRGSIWMTTKITQREKMGTPATECEDAGERERGDGALIICRSLFRVVSLNKNVMYRRVEQR